MTLALLIPDGPWVYIVCAAIVLTLVVVLTPEG